MLSQYTESYLNENERRGDGNGLTPGTYIAYHVKGKAKQYGGRYTRSLINSCRKVGAVEGESRGKRVAFYPAQRGISNA